MSETMEYIKLMDSEQLQIFNTLLVHTDHHRLEIAERVYYGTVLNVDDAHYEHPDDIWEYFQFNGTQVALTY